MMNCQSAVKILEELMLALIERGVSIPPHVVDDLKSGRSLASIGQRQPDDADILMKAMSALQSVEMNLLSLAEGSAGGEYADKWQKKIGKAYEEEPAPRPSASASKFVPGVPKGQHWIRLQASELAGVPELSGLLESFALSAAAQGDGYWLIHGRKEDVTAFLGKIRQKVGKTGCKRNS